MIKRFHNTRKQDLERQYRVNERIFAHEVRVLDNEGKQVGVMAKSEALNRARSEGVDLVEIAPNAKPPVVKLVDFQKFIYQLEKKKKEEKRKTKVQQVKEVRLGPFMGDKDLDTMASRARGFLEDGNKVKFVVKFTGAQMRHTEFGHRILGKILLKLADLSRVEREAKQEGKQISVIVTGEKKKQYAKEENKEIS